MMMGGRLLRFDQNTMRYEVLDTKSVDAQTQSVLLLTSFFERRFCCPPQLKTNQEQETAQGRPLSWRSLANLILAQLAHLPWGPTQVIVSELLHHPLARFYHSFIQPFSIT
jgi:hypothetical protein